MFTPPKASKSPRISRISTKNWLKGTISAFDSGRTPQDGLLNASNVAIYQDGTVGPRPSLMLYGPQPIGKVLGEVAEYKVQNGLSYEMRMACIQVVDGTAGLYTARGEDTSWTRVGAESYHQSAAASFFQIQNKLVVLNGEDSLSYLDTQTNTITRFSQLGTPSSPTLKAKTGLDGASFKVYYAVTANSTVGETDGGTALQVQVSTDRDIWNKDTQSIEIQWPALTGAKAYNVYMGVSSDGSGQPTLYALATGLDPSVLNYKDNGVKAVDINRPLPKNNSTAGPRAATGAVINGRLWLTRDKNNPSYVWRGGDFGFELDFSPANGGGYTPIGNGTKEVPMSVKPFRTGKGDPIVMVLTQSSNGAGKRYFLSPTTLTVGSSSFVAWKNDEDSGADGTDSPNGVVIYNNSYFYPSRDGFKTTGTKPQLQNMLSTDRISNTIQDDISRLVTKSMDKCVGVAYEGKIYWALPVGTDYNSEIWVLDLDRGGAWMKPWNIKADWMWLYNDNSGVTHFLVLSEGKIYEFTDRQYTNDNGVPFVTSLSSGENSYSEDQREWAKVLVVVFTFLQPRGEINFTVTGMTDEGPATYRTSKNYSISTTVAGWGEQSDIGISGFGRYRWSAIGNVPTPSDSGSVDEVLEIDDEFIWWKYEVSSSGAGVNYQLANVVSEHVNIGTKDLS